MRFLITGGRGFIGSHLMTELAEHGHQVVSMDVKDEPLLQDSRRRDNLDRMFAEHSPDRIIHLAARVGRLFGEDDVAETVADNAAMTAVVAKAAAAWSIPLVYASTSEIYGDCGNTVAFEAMFPRLPHNVYGLSKRWGEEACLLYAPDGLLILRFSMPYGPGLPWGRGRAALVNFLHQAITRQQIPVHKGSERSWCYIGDTVRAVRMLVEQEEIGPYNVGRDDNACPLLGVAQLACKLVGADPDELVIEIEAPPNQTVVKRLSTEKIRSIGWRPEVELNQGMAAVRDWIVAQMELDAVTSG